MENRPIAQSSGFPYNLSKQNANGLRYRNPAHALIPAGEVALIRRSAGTDRGGMYGIACVVSPLPSLACR